MSLLSRHPLPYRIEEARSNPRYASLFSRGFELFEPKTFSALAEMISRSVWSPCVFAGGHRLVKNFLSARWGALDFDDPGYPLAQAMREWCDTLHIIGLSKSHQRWKDDHPPCDRFRLVFPFAEVISEASVYSYNCDVLVSRYGADTAAKDAARLFYPCTEIVSVCKDGATQPVAMPPPGYGGSLSSADYKNLVRIKTRKFQITRRLPRRIAEFLYGGVVIKGRNHTCYCAALALFECGHEPEEVSALLEKAPFDRRGFTRREMDQAIFSAWRRFTSGGGGCE